MLQLNLSSIKDHLHFVKRLTAFLAEFIQKELSNMYFSIKQPF